MRYTGGLYKRGARREVPLRLQAPLPVLELSCHALGDASTHQADQEQYADAPADHRQDVVLGRGGHHLHSEVREAIRRGYLEKRWWHRPQGDVGWGGVHSKLPPRFLP